MQRQETKYSPKTTEDYAQVHQTGNAGPPADGGKENVLPDEDRTPHRLQAFRPEPPQCEQRNQRSGHHPRPAGRRRPSGPTVGRGELRDPGRNRHLQGDHRAGGGQGTGHPGRQGNGKELPEPPAERHPLPGGQEPHPESQALLQAATRGHKTHPPFALRQGRTPATCAGVSGQAGCDESAGLYGADGSVAHRRHLRAEGVPPRPGFGHRLHRTGKREGVCEEGVKAFVSCKSTININR